MNEPLRIVSASRRTDLTAWFPEELSEMLVAERADVRGPFGRLTSVDLNPRRVHTLALWSKNFEPLLADRFSLRRRVEGYQNLFFLFTITGLGGGEVEPSVPPPSQALEQLRSLISLYGPERVRLRFDPVLFYRKGPGAPLRSNLEFFPTLLDQACSLGIRAIVFSFAQPYSRAKRRFSKAGLEWVFPGPEEELSTLKTLASMAGGRGVTLLSCAQPREGLENVSSSRCLDGEFFNALHPQGLRGAISKDPGQRRECLCSQAVEIGSYAPGCPRPCLYCYGSLKS